MDKLAILVGYINILPSEIDRLDTQKSNQQVYRRLGGENNTECCYNTEDKAFFQAQKKNL